MRWMTLPLGEHRHGLVPSDRQPHTPAKLGMRRMMLNAQFAPADSGPVSHLLHYCRHIWALHVLPLHGAQHRNDVVVDDVLVVLLRARFVAYRG